MQDLDVDILVESAGKAVAGTGRTRQRPPLSGEKDIADSSAESLSRKIGSDSSDRSRTIARVAIRRRATRSCRENMSLIKYISNRGPDCCSGLRVGADRHPCPSRTTRRYGASSRKATRMARPTIERSTVFAQHRAVHRNAHRPRQQCRRFCSTANGPIRSCGRTSRRRSTRSQCRCITRSPARSPTRWRSI